MLRPIRIVMLAALVGAASAALNQPAYAQSCTQTLQAQVNATPTGGTLIPQPCQYHEHVTVTRAMTIAATPASGTEILGDGVRPSWITATVPGVSVSGFSMRGATDNGLYNVNVSGSNLSSAGGFAVVFWEIAGASVQHTHIANSGGGIYCGYCADAGFTDNRIRDNADSGVFIDYSDGVEIARTDIVENGHGNVTGLYGGGVTIRYSINAEIHDNFFLWNAHGGTAIWSTGVTFHGNMFAMGPTASSGAAKYARGSDAESVDTGSANGYYHWDGAGDGEDAPTPRFICRGVAMTSLYGQYNPSACEEAGGYTGYDHVVYEATIRQDLSGAERLPTTPAPR